MAGPSDTINLQNHDGKSILLLKARERQSVSSAIGISLWRENDSTAAGWNFAWQYHYTTVDEGGGLPDPAAPPCLCLPATQHRYVSNNLADIRGIVELSGLFVYMLSEEIVLSERLEHRDHLRWRSELYFVPRRGGWIHFKDLWCDPMREVEGLR